MDPFISICIPAYKNTAFVRRLLDSIGRQTFRDFEVVLTDDSAGEELQALCGEYLRHFPLRYVHNPKPAGTPENWNMAIRRARGAWIKLMHDDDWFSQPDSLEQFASAAKGASEASFIFCAYSNISLTRGEEKKLEDVHLSPGDYHLLRDDPRNLVAGNLIGPPSVTLHRRNDNIFYDKSMRWLVDIDFYIRYLRQGQRQALYLDSQLVQIGVGTEQVTSASFRRREVEIPEYFMLLEKLGEHALSNIRVFDAYWRLLRNFRITSASDIAVAGFTGRIPSRVKTMIRWQKRLPARILKLGVLSKMLMGCSYIFSSDKD